MTATVPPRNRTAADAEPAVLGERWLRRLDQGVQRVDSAVSRAVPPGLNPLAQAGAIANLAFLIASVTGVLLLFWYVPSVHQAHASMRAIEAQPLTANLLRTLHRYSSDACMLFVLVHAVKIVCARRFTGARWLAWVTGLAGLAGIGLIGWLGYWLVWDQPAQLVAQGTSRLLDVIPIFVTPLSRSFLTDGGINTLLFFVVFFAHVLLPAAVVVALWLHLARINRARWMTARPLTIWVVASLVLVSIAFPAIADEPARMANVPGRVQLDYWYLAPLLLTERLGGTGLWAALLTLGIVTCSVPWWMARRHIRPAVVDVGRCNACEQCVKDCPYGAITMVPRTDGKDRASQAQVDPARCIGCGICSGSCDSTGIGLDWFDVLDQRETLDRWLAEEPGTGIVFVCAHSVAGELHVDPGSGRCAEVVGHRVLVVPCAGWVHMLTVERCQKRGAREVVIASCGTADCRYREGPTWLQARRSGDRRPALRIDRADPARVHVLELRAGEGKRLARACADLAGGAPVPRPRGRFRRTVSAAVLWLALAGILVVGSAAPYRTGMSAEPQLVVGFRLAGEVGEIVRTIDAAEQALQPVHMRRDRVVERRRAPVRLRIVVDGVTQVERVYAPTGVWGDGISSGIESIALTQGRHRVAIALSGSHDAELWEHVAEQDVEFEPRTRRVVEFERSHGYRWH